MAAVCPVTDAFYDFLSKLFSFISVQSIYRHYIRKAIYHTLRKSAGSYIAEKYGGEPR